MRDRIAGSDGSRLVGRDDARLSIQAASGPRDNGDDAGAGDLDQADLAHQRDEACRSCRGAPVTSNTKLEVVASTTRARIDVGEAQRLDPVIAGAGDLDQRQLALDMRAERR